MMSKPAILLALQEEIIHAKTCIRPTATGHIHTAIGWMEHRVCLLYTSPSPRDLSTSRMPSSA